MSHPRDEGKLVRFGAVDLSPEMARRAREIVESIDRDVRELGPAEAGRAEQEAGPEVER